MKQPIPADDWSDVVDARVADLVLHYEEMAARGEAVSVEDLCRTCPELAPQVERILRDLNALSPYLEETASCAHGSRLTPREPSKPRPLPERFGRYRILKQLGRGGMGTVYLAHDATLDRQVALKVPTFNDAPTAVELDRFGREARAAATLRHPNICPVHDVSSVDGVPFLSMAYIDGHPLADEVREGRSVPPERAARLVRQIALAMHEAHRLGVVHRDLKPSNIMLDGRGEPIVMDFGLARRSLADEPNLTHAGAVIGTPAYMSPEQIEANHAAIGPRSDIYSLGVILYELATGKLPYRGQGLKALGEMLVKAPTPMSKAKPGVDERLEAICMKALAKDPEDRYATMAEFSGSLEAYLQGAAEGDRGRATVPIVLTAIVAAIALGIVLLFSTAHGTVRIEIDDPQAVVSLDGDVIAIEKLGKPISVRAGAHVLTVQHDGVVVETQNFRLKRGDVEVLKIAFKPGRPKDVGLPNPDAADAAKLVAAGKYEDAVAAASETIRRDPASTAAWTARAQACRYLGRFDEAIRDATETLRLDPKQPQAHLARSFARFGRREYPKAIADASAALDLEPADDVAAEAYGNRGWAFAQLGHYELAEADLDEAIRLAPKQASNLMKRGVIRAKRGNADTAKADRDAALRSDPAAAKAEPTLDVPPPLFRDEAHGWVRTMKFPARVNSIAASPNGRLALSAGDADGLRLWDVASGEEVHRFPWKHGNAVSVAFSADGRLALASGGLGVRPDGTWAAGTDYDIYVWDVPRRKLLRQLSGHTEFVQHAVFSTDGKRILSGDFQGVVRLWDVASGKTLSRMTAPSKHVWDVALAPDGTRALVAGGADKIVYVWDLKEGSVPVELRGHTGLVRAVAFSPDGQKALSGSFDKTVRLWDLASKKMLWASKPNDNVVNCVAFADQGRLAVGSTGGIDTGLPNFEAEGGPDCALHFYDAASGVERERFEGHTSNVNKVSVAMTIPLAVTSSADATVRVWRLPVAAKRSGDDRIRAAEFVAKARKFINLEQYDEAIAAADESLRLDPENVSALLLRGNACNGLNRLEDAIRSFTQALKLSPHDHDALAGRSFSYLNADDMVRCIEDCDLALSAAVNTRFPDVAYDNRGWALAMLGHYELALEDADASIRVAPKSWIGWSSRSLIRARLGREAEAKADWNESLRLNAQRTEGREVLPALPPLPTEGPVGAFHTMAGHAAEVHGVAMARNGRLALSGGADGTVRLWDVVTGGQLGTFRDHKESVRRVAFSSDGRHVLSGGGSSVDFEVRLWDIAKRKLVRSFRGHSDRIEALEFSASGNLAVTGSRDGTVRLWEVATGDERKRFAVGKAPITAVGFASDGKRIFAIADGTLRFWDSDSGNPIPAPTEESCVAYAPQSNVLLLQRKADGNLASFEPNAAKRMTALKGVPPRCTELRIGVDGKRVLVAAEGDHLLRFWDLQKNGGPGELRGHSEAILDIALSPDGRLAVTGSADRTVRLWRLQGR